MKTYTNLLAKEDIKAIQVEKSTTVVLNFFIWVVASLVIMALFLLAGRVFLGNQLSQTEDLIELQRQVVSKEENQELKKTLEEFNNHLSNLVNLDRHQGQWSEVLISFARLLPKDLTIDSFSADRKTGRVKIVGFSKTRESVLRLRQNLLESAVFTEVNFPLTNLVKPANLTFSYTFFVHPDLMIKGGEDENDEL